MTGKYPASIIDMVAAAIALAMDDTHLFVDDPRYPGKGLGAPHSEEYIEEVRAGAVAALDALPSLIFEYGTAVREKSGEVWDHEPLGSKPTGGLLAKCNAEHREEMGDDWDGSRIVFVYRFAETDWEVVSDGTE